MLQHPYSHQASSSDDRTKTLEESEAWAFVRWLATRSDQPSHDAVVNLGRDAQGTVGQVDSSEAWLVLDEALERGYALCRPATAAATQLLDLFVPLCTGEYTSELVVAHMAQSLDGRIATEDGESQFISGDQDLIHTHRLRAICDAVVVGVRTALCDNPLLTTRLVEGEHATRVVLDPRGTLPKNSRLLLDSSAPTLVVTANPSFCGGASHVEAVTITSTGGRLDFDALFERLHERGLRRLFIEGGGVTVSRFLEASLLDRLHIAVAPTILGSGRSSIELPPIQRLEERRRLAWRTYALGSDLLLDCDLRGDRPSRPS